MNGHSVDFSLGYIFWIASTESNPVETELGASAMPILLSGIIFIPERLSFTRGSFYTAVHYCAVLFCVHITHLSLDTDLRLSRFRIRYDLGVHQHWLLPLSPSVAIDHCRSLQSRDMGSCVCVAACVRLYTTTWELVLE